MAQVRINKYISDAGFCSRREADKLIDDARVTVNGTVAVPGTKVSEGDTVRIDGESLRANPQSFVERPKKTKVRKPFRRPAPAENEGKENARPSHHGTRGGARNKASDSKRPTPARADRPKRSGGRNDRH